MCIVESSRSTGGINTLDCLAKIIILADLIFYILSIMALPFCTGCTPQWILFICPFWKAKSLLFGYTLSACTDLSIVFDSLG